MDNGLKLYVPIYFCWYVYNLRIYATVHGIYYSTLILLATGNLIHNVPLKLVRTIISGEYIPSPSPLIAATLNVYLVFGSNIDERYDDVFTPNIVVPKSLA